LGPVILVYLKDGCIAFELYISAKLSADGNDWLPLDSLLSEVTIKKAPARKLRFLPGTRTARRTRWRTAYYDLLMTRRVGEEPSRRVVGRIS
jgi:hypothetical protein